MLQEIDDRRRDGHVHLGDSGRRVYERMHAGGRIKRALVVIA